MESTLKAREQGYGLKKNNHKKRKRHKKKILFVLFVVKTCRLVNGRRMSRVARRP